MANKQTAIEIWDLWYPHGGATGVPFARGRLDATDILIVHAAPESLTVEIRTDDGQRLAYGKDLARTADRPMARLTRRGETIEREDTWLDASDIGRPVILPGGEVGILLLWWNADDGSEWRWQVEFYNHR
ncbi:MAG TPA: hypothetical protein VFD70_13295 [Anaerolineae bacterium]|nr:hypothetical protein [Anaerolineae bacterium]